LRSDVGRASRPHCLLGRSSNDAAAKVLSRPVNSKRSSVSRTQLFDTHVGDEVTVVDQVARSMAGQGLVDKRSDLEHDALPHRKPV